MEDKIYSYNRISGFKEWRITKKVEHSVSTTLYLSAVINRVVTRELWVPRMTLQCRTAWKDDYYNIFYGKTSGALIERIIKDEAL